jgi:hypothetical protein
MIRIGFGQVFWGDSQEAPVRLVEDGPLDYLALDYLAEVTMSILQKQKNERSDLGYARDFPALIERIAQTIQTKRIRVVANAGGVNPQACAREILRRCPQLRVAVVLGDDLMGRLAHLVASGEELRNMDTGANIADILDSLQSANAYLGAYPIAEALHTGADIVVTGRCADAALVLGPMIHAYGWQPNDWARLSAGIAAGHIVECGAQCTGGNCLAHWEQIPDLANVGYPIVEAHEDGTATITKHPGSGGCVTLATVKEQLVYEVADPRAYFTPDVVADFTSLHLEQTGADQVRLSGARGTPRPEKLKASISYKWGYKASGTLVYSAPQGAEKARRAAAILRQRCHNLGLHLEKIHEEIFGEQTALLRVAVRDRQKENVDRWTRELIPLVLNGPPGATGYGDGRPKLHEVVAYWPALLSRNAVQPKVELL